MMNKQELRKELIKLQMDNPCLSHDIDYENDSIRLDYYTKNASTLSGKELKQEIQELRGGLK